jgi:hypothetical protein
LKPRRDLFYDALVVPFDADSGLMVARDVCNHRQATLDLENSNRFPACEDDARCVVCLTSSKRILYVNPGARSTGLLGDFRKMGDAFLDITVHPEDQPRLQALAQEYAKAADGTCSRAETAASDGCRKFTVFSWTPDGRRNN